MYLHTIPFDASVLILCVILVHITNGVSPITILVWDSCCQGSWSVYKVNLSGPCLQNSYHVPVCLVQWACPDLVFKIRIMSLYSPVQWACPHLVFKICIMSLFVWRLAMFPGHERGNCKYISIRPHLGANHSSFMGWELLSIWHSTVLSSTGALGSRDPSRVVTDPLSDC